MIRVEYYLSGKLEFSLYSAEWYSVEDAIAEVLELMPHAKIKQAYLSQVVFK